MKTLTLLRHAKSGWDDPVARDFDRALNPRGVRGARTMGRHMRDLGMRFDHVVSSPAVRCVDTLDALWEGFGRVLHPVWDRRIYLASSVTLLDVMRDQPDTAQHVLACGHNPGFEELVLMLASEDSGGPLRGDIEEKFPTASFAEMTFDVAVWSAVHPGGGQLARFVRPRDLDRDLGPEAE